MATAFISGHLDLTENEFVDHYRPTIEAAVKRGDSFVVGDAPGGDYLAQFFLSIVKAVGQYRIDVTVYHILETPRHNEGKFKTSGHYASQNAKDAAMTYASDYDIAWVRPGREQSGTARNLERRAKMERDREHG